MKTRSPCTCSHAPCAETMRADYFTDMCAGMLCLPFHAVDPNPSAQHRKALAERLGLSEEQVSVRDWPADILCSTAYCSTCTSCCNLPLIGLKFSLRHTFGCSGNYKHPQHVQRERGGGGLPTAAEATRSRMPASTAGPQGIALCFPYIPQRPLTVQCTADGGALPQVP